MARTYLLHLRGEENPRRVTLAEAALALHLPAKMLRHLVAEDHLPLGITPGTDDPDGWR